MSSDELNSVQPEEARDNGEPLPAADPGDELPPVAQDQAAAPPEITIEEPEPAEDDTPITPAEPVSSPVAAIEEPAFKEGDTPVPPVPILLSEDYILTGGELLTVLPDEEAVSPASDVAVDEPEPKEGDTPVPPLSTARPPRIVSEAPLGGSIRPRPMARPAPPESKAAPMPAEPTNKADQPAAPVSESPAEPPASAAPPAQEDQSPEPVPPAETKPLTPTQPPSRVKVSESAPAARREDWQDDDLSPELAAVLFGERKSKAAVPAETQPPAAAPTPEAKPAAPAAEPEAAAEPIALTDIATARRLSLTAKGHSAAAPDAALQAKTRYVRLEEPLSGDGGQRTVETWTYFKPDYPSLDGRLVKHVRSVEVAYADGSWAWLYERHYSDRGRDRRLVRASADRSYVERDDTVSKLDPQTGRRVKYHEDAAMILAAPEREEKHGLFGGLLSRGDDDQYTEGRKTWRDATASERRQARKQGGQAFPRRFLGIF